MPVGAEVRRLCEDNLLLTPPYARSMRTAWKDSCRFWAPFLASTSLVENFEGLPGSENGLRGKRSGWAGTSTSRRSAVMGRLLCGGALNQRAMRDDPHDLQVIGRKGRAVRD